MAELHQNSDTQEITVKAAYKTPQLVTHGRLATFTLQVGSPTISGGGEDPCLGSMPNPDLCGEEGP